MEGDGEEENEEDRDEADEIDPSIEASDVAIIKEVAVETDEQADTPVLTHTDINLGRFAIMKVI